ncbi:beta-aspartyl-peptidase [Natranaerobius thermophilus]|uniref:Isoaspartyl dipeptidase n=1 Tax=Natranaerobius thermophilus (strain ATCC BAA-1301 / DSM 18059 / JW/NM-WN-LF) TaxID=457570 RepID=B2A0N0_NATTJ|nr:beta-aspartyl-peptidase [Natranaerobius thermophilus]ACB84588.1 isoaspartyl dipeptidase [Natranaerobius thermophilus JW/NM-WN-LF]
MVTLIRGGQLYTPEYQGKKDVLLTGEKIAYIDDNINLQSPSSQDGIVEEIDARGKFVVPGFIDGHVHLIGGGGEGGFATRTPEIELSNIITSGITTVIGCLGTDGITREMKDLLAKARGLREEGISTYILSGSYKVPVTTLTGEVQKDIVLVPEVLGVGEIALSDHRSFEPTISELKKLVAETRVAAMLSGKKGIINVHMGDGVKMFQDIDRIIEETELPGSHFVVTHGNRTQGLFNEGLELTQKGVFLDLTTSTVQKFIEDGEIKCSRALKYFDDNGITPDNVTFSSDGQGSLPNFSESGDYLGLKVGGVESLYREVKEAVTEENVPLENALRVITKNPASAYGLNNKGELTKGKDGDLILLDEDTLEIDTVISRGKTLIKNKEILQKGTFE